MVAANRSGEHHIQRLQAAPHWKDQNTVVSGDVLTRQAFDLAVSVVGDRVHQDGAEARAAIVGVDQRRHLSKRPAPGCPDNGDAIQLGLHGGFIGVPGDLHCAHRVVT